MEGSEADDPTVVKAPGNADAPVVLNTLALTRIAVGADLGDGLLLARGTGGAIVADEDVTGRVERDTGDPRKRQARNHSLLERAGGTDEAAGRVDRRAAWACGGVKPWLSSSSAQHSMISIVHASWKATEPDFFRRGPKGSNSTGTPMEHFP